MSEDDLSPEEERLLEAIVALSKSSGWCRANTKILSTATALPPKVVVRCISRLAGARYIVVRNSESGRECRVVSESEHAELIRNGTSATRTNLLDDDDTGSGDMPVTRSRPAPSVAAALTGDLLNRPRILTTLMREQAAREPPVSGDDPPHDDGSPEASPTPNAGASFDLWMRFVLSPEQLETFRSWAAHHGAAYSRLKMSFRKARGDVDLEALLENILAAITAGPGKDTSTAALRTV